MWSYTSKDNQWKDINLCRKRKWNAFLSRYEVYDFEIYMSKCIVVIDNNNRRKNMTYIRIGNESSSSYLKATTQCNHHILHPIMKMRQLGHVFLNSILADILEAINQSVNESVSVPTVCKNIPVNSSKSTSTSSSKSTSHDTSDLK